MPGRDKSVQKAEIYTKFIKDIPKITKYTTKYILHIIHAWERDEIVQKARCIPFTPVSATPSQNTKLWYIQFF